MSSDWLTTKITKAWSSCFRIDFVERKKIFSLYFFSNKNVGVGSRFQNIISVKIEDSVEERFFRTDIETSIKLLSNLTAALNLLSMKYKSLLLCKTISKKIGYFLLRPLFCFKDYFLLVIGIFTESCDVFIRQVSPKLNQ